MNTPIGTIFGIFVKKETMTKDQVKEAVAKHSLRICQVENGYFIGEPIILANFNFLDYKMKIQNSKVNAMMKEYKTDSCEPSIWDLSTKGAVEKAKNVVKNKS